MKVSARFIFPVASPAVQNGIIDIDAQGVIAAVRAADKNETVDSEICLLPGFVNAHCHLAYTALRNRFDNLPFFPWIRKLTEMKSALPEHAVRASTKLGIAESLLTGITTVADLSDMQPALDELSRSPLSGVFYHEVFGVSKEQADETWAAIPSMFPDLRNRFERPRLKVGISPHATYTIRPELYTRIGEWAAENHFPVSFHLAESREEEEFIAKRSGPIHEFLKIRASDWEISGRSSVEHLDQTGILECNPLVAHAVQVSADDMETLRRKKVAVAHCPKSNAKFGHGIAPVEAMRNAGIIVGLGTDSAASNNRIDFFEEARFALLMQRAANKSVVPTEEDILKMMTLEGARAMKLESSVGSLEPGKQADFIAIRIPPLYQTVEQCLFHVVNNATPEDVKGVWIGGMPLDLSSIRNEIKMLEGVLAGSFLS